MDFFLQKTLRSLRLRNKVNIKICGNDLYGITQGYLGGQPCLIPEGKKVIIKIYDRKKER